MQLVLQPRLAAISPTVVVQQYWRQSQRPSGCSGSVLAVVTAAGGGDTAEL